MNLLPSVHNLLVSFSKEKSEILADFGYSATQPIFLADGHLFMPGA
jgi:hypothetical protein